MSGGYMSGGYMSGGYMSGGYMSGGGGRLWLRTSFKTSLFIELCIDDVDRN